MASASDLLLVVHGSVAATRARGAVLAELAGRPALRLLLDRLDAPSTLGAATRLVLTSDLAADDAVVDVARTAGWAVVRGPSDDLLAGLSVAQVRYPAEAVALVEGTGPLGDPHLVAAVAQLHQRARADHTANLAPRSYPRGLDVEVFATRALRRAELDLTERDERDHVGAQLRQHPERFRLANLASGHALAEEDWTIDQLEQLQVLVGQVGDPVAASWNRILSVGGRTRRPRPGDVVLTPRPAPAAGISPWVQRWDATLDGRDIGSITSSMVDGRTETEVHIAADHREAARAAFYRLVAADHPQGV